MISLIREENISYKKRKVCYIYKKEFSTDDDNRIEFNKKYHKVRDIVIILENIEELLIIFVI